LGADLEVARGAAAWEPLADQPMLCVARPVHAPLEQTPDVQGLWLAGPAPPSVALALASVAGLAYPC
jgi:hypothetical protein